MFQRGLKSFWFYLFSKKVNMKTLTGMHAIPLMSSSAVGWGQAHSKTTFSLTVRRPEVSAKKLATTFVSFFAFSRGPKPHVGWGVLRWRPLRVAHLFRKPPTSSVDRTAFAENNPERASRLPSKAQNTIVPLTFNVYL